MKGFELNESVLVLENTIDGVFKWDGIVTKIESNYIETAHNRNPNTHPQWRGFHRAYDKTLTKHYTLSNLEKRPKVSPNKDPQGNESKTDIDSIDI